MLKVTGLVTGLTSVENVATSATSLKQALTIGRGGAVIVAVSSVSSLLLGSTTTTRCSSNSISSTTHKAQVPRGGATATKISQSAIAETRKIESWLSPRGTAVLFMAIAMALHYLGYSLARPITISLFTSAEVGYGNKPFAFPFAMAFVSPMSLLLLMQYGKVLEKYGPRGALNLSTILCALVISVSALAIQRFESAGSTIAGGIPAAKIVSGPLFVFRESYVQLLTSQYWSFMASALTPSQSAKWFGPIAGLTSITSALAGFGVSAIIDRIGIAYALLGTAVALLLSLFAINVAYGVAETHGFSPTQQSPKKNTTVSARSSKRTSSKSTPQKHNGKGENMFQKAIRLFARVPVLGKLFVEILASQGLATILNVAFVARLQRSIPNDAERAGWVGKFFSVINIITMVLQFGILPPLLTHVEPKLMWRVVPMLSLICTFFQAFQRDPSLHIVSATLLVMKVLEYSARRMLDEMVFVPLDFESRFVGKEVIGVFGYRFGKSLMSLGLSGLTALFGSFGIQEYSILSALVNIGWLQTAWSLSNEVPTRKEAEEIYAAQHSTKKQPARKN